MQHRSSSSGLPEQPAGTAAFSKFVHLLQLVADRDEPCSIAELTRLSGYPRATVYRTVAGLAAERLLAESLRGDGYVLGPRLVQLASKSWGRSELRLAAVQDLKHLRDITGETVHLAVPNGLEMVYIEKLESPSAVRMASRIGTSVSMHSTSVGKAYLAMLDTALCDAILERLEFPVYTPNTAKNVKALRQQLAQVRERGWSVDDEENEAGIYCFGAPIHDAAGRPIAAISVSTLRFRQKPDPVQSYAQPLLAACRAISERIAQAPAFATQETVW